jgi:GT2 family glycosyltransferase
MAPSPISIVVLQWNNLEFTQECVGSLRTQSSVEHEIVIVDNGSEDAAASWARSHADRSVLLDRNTGFAKGMNAGLDVVTCETVAFVNNDTQFPADWDRPLNELLGDDQVGIVAPAVTNGGNASSVRTEPGTVPRTARPFIDLPSGVVYMLRSSYIRSLGGWQEDYQTASAEDLDLLFTVWVTGKHVVIDDRVLVEHTGSATASTQLPNRAKVWRQNRRQFASTWQEMNDASFRERYGWTGPVSSPKLAEARIAAYWMSRYFDESDAHGRTRADVGRALELHPPEVPKPSHRWPHWPGRGRSRR